MDAFKARCKSTFPVGNQHSLFRLCTTSAIQSAELCYEQKNLLLLYLKCIKFDSQGYFVMYKIVSREADHRTVNGLQKRGKKRNFLILIVMWIA